MNPYYCGVAPLLSSILMRSLIAACALLTAAQTSQTFAQTIIYSSQLAQASKAPAPQQTPAAPTLIVAISVDQFSADLFAEYRGQFTGGLKRLQEGAVFPSGYQSHAATETCPGHSTILTGDHPARTGIIANDWINLGNARDDKTVYCAEDESLPGSTSDKYTVSDRHLKVPTLGDRMKAANPAAKVISVAGKDRAAVMMGGHKVDELWWWDGKKFASYAGRTEPTAVAKANESAARIIASTAAPISLSPFCIQHSQAISIGDGKTVGTGRFARAAGDARSWRASPEFDQAVIGLAGDLIHDNKLGQGSTADIIAIGASATDYVGHTYGTSGSEMCINLTALDMALGNLLDLIDREGVDYLVVLTADHGGHDLPERNVQHAVPQAKRIDASLAPQVVGADIAKKLGLKAQPLNSRGVGDIWIDQSLNAKLKAKVLTEALVAYRANPLVAAAFSKAEIAATQIPSTPPESWTLIERARASFDPDISGDLFVALKPRVMPIADPTKGYVATHGSIWDYDRRVPILFYRKGIKRFEQPLSVETVDIAPSLAAIIGLPVPAGEMDGRCLDMDASEATTCP
jgi:predicted AlkP superfamily pyrophosphatase or phosphodiesterase